MRILFRDLHQLNVNLDNPEEHGLGWKIILILYGFSRIESINEASDKLTSFRNTHQLQFNLEEHNRTSGRLEIWSNACFFEEFSEVLSELDDDYLGDSDDEDDLQDNMEIKDDDPEFKDSKSL